MGETAQILALFSRARARDERVCLATVVHVEGSSYRKPGARMIVTSGGERAGTISGGCLEAEVSRKAWWLTRNGPVVEQYQSSFDEDGGGLPWGLGCGGTVWVLLEQEPLAVFAALEASLREGAPAVIVSRLGSAARASEAPGTAAVIRHSRSSESEGPQHLRGVVADAFSARRSLALDEALNPSGSDLPSYFIEYLAPPPHLTLFGAGDDAQPVCRFAEALGWRLTVADGRSHLLRPERFPAAELRLLHYDDSGSAPVVACGLNEGAGAVANAQIASATVVGTKLKDGLPDETARIPAVDPGLAPSGTGLEFAVLLTHSYEQDRSLLAALLPRTLDYLGVLGPRHRTRRLIEEIAPTLGWTPEECFAHLHSPVGLDLGASDPAAIALAIVAELQATVTGRAVAVRRPEEHELVPASAGQSTPRVHA